jgi:phage terminase large subunit
VKEKFAKLQGIDPSYCRAVYKGKVLKDDDILEQIEEQEHLETHFIVMMIKKTVEEPAFVRED